MRCRRLGARAGRVLAAALAFFSSVAGAQAAEKVVLAFNKTQGSSPQCGLVADAAGNLYGTTTTGGAKNFGTVFDLSPGSGGTWTATVLYSFQSYTAPFGTMTFDKAGNLYGTASPEVNSQIFELSKGANGTWSETVIQKFSIDEGTPFGDLAWDASGNLYGTTEASLTNRYGEVFELSPQPNGSWKETIIYTFPAPNGVKSPVGGVIFDGKGNLYGAAGTGSNVKAYGAVYKLSPQANGSWALAVLHNFIPEGVYGPNSTLTFDANGNLYGTTSQNNTGAVFELSPGSGDGWAETAIHVFSSGSDGGWPRGALTIDSGGNLYGVTLFGGLGCNLSLCGTVYRFSPQGGGVWKETILHTFESAEDGSEPQAGLLLDSAGNLYGTTPNGGGRFGYGTVYEITP